MVSAENSTTPSKNQLQQSSDYSIKRKGTLESSFINQCYPDSKTRKKGQAKKENYRPISLIQKFSIKDKFYKTNSKTHYKDHSL